MKLVLINLIVILAASSALAQAASPKAFEKLNKMFDAASAPKTLDQVLVEIAKIKGCAGSASAEPDQIQNFPWLRVVKYTSPAHGPGFPSETLTGIALDSEPAEHRFFGSYFFSGYTSKLGAQALEINGSTHFYSERECEIDSEGDYVCSDNDKSPKINLRIKLSATYIHFLQGNSVAYCWK